MPDKNNYPFIVKLFKKYVIFTFKRFYSEYIVVGRENIPTDCPVILAPTHLNALMDALAVHSIAPENQTVTFLARSDIFKNKLVAWFLTGIKIMPAFRMRDGMENLGKNNDIFDRCVEVLHNNNAIGIMPEGNQGDQRKLRMFTKGIFRIAFAAQQKYGSQSGVKIVPIGIDFGDFVMFRRHIIINVGKPIDVSDYILNYNENPVKATNEIRDRLRSDLSNISLDLATQNHYECFATATEVANTAFVENMNTPNQTFARFKARQKIAEKLVIMEKNELQKIEELESLCNNYTAGLKKINFRTGILEQSPYNTITFLIHGILLSATFPVFIYGFILNFFPFFSPVFIRKYLLKVQYNGFFSSIHYGLGIFSFPIFYLLQTILLASVVTVPWWIIGLFFFSQYVVGEWALYWYRAFKKYSIQIRYSNLQKKKSALLEEIQTIRKKIIQLIKD